MRSKEISRSDCLGLSPGGSPQPVGYIRVSTENQVDGYGLEAQASALRVYAKKQKLGIIHIYTEKGISGDLEDRPALGQLMTDVKLGSVTSVIVVRLDRLARDLMLQENILADLSNHGAKLISIDEPDLCSSDPTRVLFRQIKGAISEYEKKMIKVRLKAGRVSKAREGGFVGGRRPLGYVRSEKFNGKKRPDLTTDPEASETVKTIFKLKRRGWSLSRIARYLQDNGIPTACGGRWYQSTVSYIIHNPIYRGRITYKGQNAKRIDLTIK